MTEKKYELVFEHPSGLILTILTDDIYGLSEQAWFAQFFQEAQLVPQEMVEEPEPPVPAPPPQMRQQPQMQPQMRRAVQEDPYGASVNPAMQRGPVQQRPMQQMEQQRPKSFMDVSAEAMNMDIWSQLSPQQREEWQRKWLK